MSRLTVSASSPFGPLTLTRPGSTAMSTPSGIVMGLRPIRLISKSPHVGDDLAADALVGRLVSGHDPGRGADDRRAHPALHAGDLVARDEAPPAGPRDPLEAADHRAPRLRVAQADADRLADTGRLDLVAVDVALLGEDPAHLDLE